MDPYEIGQTLRGPITGHGTGKISNSKNLCAPPVMEDSSIYTTFSQVHLAGEYL
jgi:hypothetical protein